MREHVNDAGRFQPVTCVIDEDAGIARQCARMTGYVHNALRGDAADVLHDLGSAAAGRVQQQAIPGRAQPAFRTIDGGSGRRGETLHWKIIACRVSGSPVYQCHLSLDTEDLPGAPRQRQREVADATEQIEHTVVRP